MLNAEVNDEVNDELSISFSASAFSVQRCGTNQLKSCAAN
jgi:hypothetical protein